MAKRCPFLDFGGTLEVAKMLEMPQRVLLLLKLYIRHGFVERDVGLDVLIRSLDDKKWSPSR